MKKVVAVLLLCVICLGASACTTRAKHNAQINARVGSHIDTVIAEWGEPTNKLVGAEDYAIYQWYRQETYNKLGMSEKNWCQNSFTVAPGGIIQSASSRGNDCAGEGIRSFFVHF